MTDELDDAQQADLAPSAGDLQPLVGSWSLAGWREGKDARLPFDPSDPLVELRDGAVVHDRGFAALDRPLDPSRWGRWVRARGMTLTISADARLVEDVQAGPVAVTWWDTEGVLCDTAEPFDGRLVSHEGKVFAVPVGGDGYLWPRPHIRGNQADSFVTDHLQVTPRGHLLRSVKAYLDHEVLSRAWYRYEQVVTPTRPRPVKDRDQPAPTLEEGKRVHVPADTQQGRELRELMRQACAVQEEPCEGFSVMGQVSSNGRGRSVVLLPDFGLGRETRAFDPALRRVADLVRERHVESEPVGLLVVYTMADEVDDDGLTIVVFTGRAARGWHHNGLSAWRPLVTELVTPSGMIIPPRESR